MSKTTAVVVTIVSITLLAVSIALIYVYGMPALTAIGDGSPVVFEAPGATPESFNPTLIPRAASPTSAPPSDIPSTTIGLERDELAIRLTALVNVERERVGSSPVALSASLATVGEVLLENPNGNLHELAVESGYYPDDLWWAMPTLAKVNAEDLLAVLQQSFGPEMFRFPAQDIGIAFIAGVGGNQFAVIFSSEVSLTAPGADIHAPGDPSQGGQEQEIVRLLNAVRVAAGNRPLTTNPVLTRTAAGHSADQAGHDTMTHDGSDGSTPADRARVAGYRYASVGENVLMRGDIHAAGAFDQWWNSPPHHENMMNPEFTQIGIAYARGASGYYYTMVLGTPQS